MKRQQYRGRLHPFRMAVRLLAFALTTTNRHRQSFPWQNGAAVTKKGNGRGDIEI
jgi:hypothetical protein